MKCCSRSTLGVVIGILNVPVCLDFLNVIFLTIFRVASYIYESIHEGIIFSVLLVVCLVMLVVSGLLITGIIKKRHKLMHPWLILSSIIFVIGSAKLAYDLYYFDIYLSLPLLEILKDLILSLIEIGISALMIWFIYTLYKDIRKDNISKSGQVMNGSQIE